MNATQWKKAEQEAWDERRPYSNTNPENRAAPVIWAGPRNKTWRQYEEFARL